MSELEFLGALHVELLRRKELRPEHHAHELFQTSTVLRLAIPAPGIGEERGGVRSRSRHLLPSLRWSAVDQTRIHRPMHNLASAVCHDETRRARRVPAGDRV